MVEVAISRDDTCERSMFSTIQRIQLTLICTWNIYQLPPWNYIVLLLLHNDSTPSKLLRTKMPIILLEDCVYNFFYIHIAH